MCERQDGMVSLDDLYRAYEDCRKRKKEKRGAVSFEPYAVHSLCRIRDEINSRKYQLKKSQCFVIKYPVPREVFCAAFRDRIVQHFVYNELNPVIEKLIIRDTASCRVGKGTDYAIHRCQTFVRRETENYTSIDGVYFGKFDLSGFFMSIDRQKLLEKVLWVVDNRYKGKFKDVLHYLLPIIILSDVTVGADLLCPASEWDILPARKTLFGNSKGLPIGNITSQLFANFYLNDVDHLMKSRHRSYIRYVDDIVVIDRDKKKLEETRRMLAVALKREGLKLNERKSIISPIRWGVTFLGVKVRPFYSVLSRRRINRLWHTSRTFDSPLLAYRSCGSRKGMFERYHGRHLAERWYRSLDPSIREYLKMDSRAVFRMVGIKALSRNDKLRNIRIYG